MCSQENMEGAHVPADPTSGFIGILKRADKVQACPRQAPKHLHARLSGLPANAPFRLPCWHTRQSQHINA